MTTMFHPTQSFPAPTAVACDKTSPFTSPARRCAMSDFRHSPVRPTPTHETVWKTSPTSHAPQHDTPSEPSRAITTPPPAWDPADSRRVTDDAAGCARPTHVRAKSAIASMSSYSKAKICGDAVGSNGVEASSRAAGRGSLRRSTSSRHSRTPSTVSAFTAGSNPAPVALEAAVSNCESMGSFTPTSCPRQSLLSLLAPNIASPTPRRARARELSCSTPCPSDTDDSGRSSPSPPSTLDSPIPSICRTPSDDNGSDYFPSVPPSTGPSTPSHSPYGSPRHPQTKSLHVVLESLEDVSMFRVQTSCATCKKLGANFPYCPKCGEMWCSRECRLRGGNGKKHICSKSGC